MTVEAGRSGERVIYAPVTAQTSSGYYYGTLNFSVSGYGVESGMAGSVNHPGSYGGGRTGYIGMGRAVSAKHWSALRNNLTSAAPARSSGPTHSELDGSEVDMASAPEDWRGYSGLEQLWMAESEWLAMRPAAKAAMLDWVAMGGRVYVLASESTEARAQQLGMPPLVGDVRRHGAGDIVLMEAKDGTLSIFAMTREVHRADASGLRSHLDGYDKKWGLRELAGELSLKAGLIFGFIAIFGILVGPVNLFWLAPAGRRQRMFWTTPLLSLGGSLVLLAIMVLQDGIGGNGARLTLGILQPEQKRLAIMQEQVSRSGVLLGRAFPIGEPGWMQPLELARPGYANPMREARHEYTETETMRRGDWFSSRSVQAHLLETVRPSRAAIEVFPAAAVGEAPSVLSNLESSLKVLFIVDDAKQVWRAEDVGTGEKKATKRSSRAELDAWLLNGPARHAGPVIAATMAELGKQTGCAFAELADASKFAVPTLSSIRWTDDHAIVAGKFLKR
jgi:hypothetical protein